MVLAVCAICVFLSVSNLFKKFVYDKLSTYLFVIKKKNRERGGGVEGERPGEREIGVRFHSHKHVPV